MISRFIWYSSWAIQLSPQKNNGVTPITTRATAARLSIFEEKLKISTVIKGYQLELVD
jgi:hypothetical protein